MSKKSKNMVRCEYCKKKVKVSNYLEHKSKVHPKQLSEEEKEVLGERFGHSDRPFMDRWSGALEEAVAEIKGLGVSTIEDHTEKASLLEWMTTALSSDPLWRNSTKYISDYDFNMELDKMGRIEEEHPLWVIHLESGGPTYFGVLNVGRNDSVEKIKRQYDFKKRNYSSYPDELLDDALHTLTDAGLKKEYDNLVSIVNKINRGLNSQERKEIVAEHDSWIKDENSVMIMEHIRHEHMGWELIFRFGAPTLHKIIGIKRRRKIEGEKLKEAIESKKVLYPNAGELMEEIYPVLQSPILRWEYEFLLDFLKLRIEEGDMNGVVARRDGWKRWDDRWNILAYLLREHNDAFENIKRWTKIINKHNDWESYLPPNEGSFYTILGIDESGLPPDDDSISSLLRNHYRRCERTPEVNLAYSILKNKNIRRDYTWMCENNDLMHQMYEFLRHRERDIWEEETELTDLEELIPE